MAVLYLGSLSWVRGLRPVLSMMGAEWRGGGEGVGEERERETERETERDRERETDRQINRQTDRDRDRNCKRDCERGYKYLETEITSMSYGYVE